MALTYSLKYKKLNLFYKVLLEKEGEIVVDRQSFRLKGKGAKDQGEAIFFSDIREMKIKDDELAFSTFGKERYILCGFSNLFDSFLKDFMRVRNEYFAEALLMKEGMLIKEFEASIEVLDAQEKVIPKGRSRIQFYEGSIVMIPEMRECFSVPLNFLKGHEFDEEDYVLRLFLETGQTVSVSKLGTLFGDVRETMEGLLGKMYERVLHNLPEFLPGFDATTLLKLAYKMKEGRFVAVKTLKKMHEDLPGKMTELMGEKNELMRERMDILKKMGGDEYFYGSVSFGKAREGGDLFARTWFLQGIPGKNLIAVARTSSKSDEPVHFFRIIAQQGDATERLGSKILEVEQCLLRFKYDFSLVYKDRRDLRKSRYRTALKKLSFLRLLRKSYVGRSAAVDAKSFMLDIERVEAKARLIEKSSLPKVAHAL